MGGALSRHLEEGRVHPGGEVVPGQCEPYTAGWRLRLVKDGIEQVLLEGTYYDLRRVQHRCFRKAADKLEGIVAEAVEEMKNAPQPPPLPSGRTDEATEILGMDEVRRAMLHLEMAAALGEDATRIDWLDISERDGVAVASVKPDSDSVGAEQVGIAFGAALGSASSGLVADLRGLPAEGPELAEVLRALVERAKAENRFLGLVGATDEVRGDMEAALGEVTCLFPDIETALIAAGGDASPAPFGDQPDGEAEAPEGAAAEPMGEAEEE